MRKSSIDIAKRRHLMLGLGASLTLWQLPALAAKDSSSPAARSKIIWCVLRGGMDSLHAVVPAFDPHLLAHRASLAAPLMDNLLPLDRGFGLHPALKHLHTLYQTRHMTPVVAVATPYRARSHFEAQDILESGAIPADHDNGWLNRALLAGGGEGIAIAQSLPITLRGESTTRTWYPDSLPAAGNDVYSRLLALYANDQHLKNRLQEALDTRAMADTMETARRPQIQALANACGKLMRAPNGPDCAMLEMGGWDTHSSQVGRLERQFGQLDAGIKQLQYALADAWKSSIVVIATEFGRTVKNNGTRGTDHGTASAVFLVGGALKGGKVLGDWPGLATQDLHQKRDLMPTSDIRSWLGAVLKQHWAISDKRMSGIFPGAASVNTTLV